MGFTTLAIANRGEIARRIQRTARRLGIATVALFSDADRSAVFVREADRAVGLGGNTPRESYLNRSAVIRAALRADAEAIHPGYGFLSENAAFARECVAAGLIFVGPRPESIEAMSDKRQARALMERAGVRVVPGFSDPSASDGALGRAAAEIGFPVLVKAVAGGGGRGMRIVNSREELGPALDSARREAKSAFDNEEVFLEKYFDHPRHIEVQIFGDQSGTIVHMGERDCSFQRRFQKLIEEAPAPGLDETIRVQLAETALLAGQAVHYVGAGTVEFLVQDGQFYFIEMNTRLQVEHPVTESVTGIDLVEWQLRIAAGDPIPRPQARIVIQGHAIEVRVNAEDPSKEFMPSIGTITELVWPDGIRIDSGFEIGDVISPYYDSLVAKLISHGADRGQARRRLRHALLESHLTGVQTNIGFLARILEDDAYRAGGFDTGLLERGQARWTGGVKLHSAQWALAAWAVYSQSGLYEAGITGDPFSPWRGMGNWWPNLPTTAPVELSDGDGVVRRFCVTLDNGATRIEEPEAGASWALVEAMIESGTISAEVDGIWEKLACRIVPGAIVLFVEGSAMTLSFPEQFDLEKPDEIPGTMITAPLPGVIQEILVQVGQCVEAGAVLVKMEAMKMEYALRAGVSGEVIAIHAAPGDQVAEGTEIVEVEEK